MRQETEDFLVGGGPKTEKTWDFLFEHEIFSWDMRQEIFSWGGCTNRCPVSWENLMSQEKISCLKRKSHVFSVLGPPQKKISCLLSHEKILFPKRKSHVFSVLSPPQQENLLSPVSRENLWSQEKISCLFSIWSPPNKKISCLLSHEKISCLKRKSHLLSVLGPPLKRKSLVSFLMRKSHVQRENLMSFQFWVPPNEKISCLLSHEKISWPKRKSYVFSV